MNARNSPKSQAVNAGNSPKNQAVNTGNAPNADKNHAPRRQAVGSKGQRAKGSMGRDIGCFHHPAGKSDEWEVLLPMGSKIAMNKQQYFQTFHSKREEVEED